MRQSGPSVAADRALPITVLTALLRDVERVGVRVRVSVSVSESVSESESESECV